MRKRNIIRLVLLGFIMIATGLTFTSSVEATNIPEGNIVSHGHASTPKASDVASSKYAVIAQFTQGSSKLVYSGPTRRSSFQGRALIVEPANSQKGKMRALYTNIGTYKGRTLDFEFVVTDWVKAGFNGGEYMYFHDNHIGFNQSGYTTVSLKGTYLYADTGKPATDLTGSYMTVNDLDANQFMGFSSSMMNKIDKMYAYSNTKVSYWGVGNRTRIGARFLDALESDDQRGFVTFLVSGYQFDFEWGKDWTRPSSDNNPYNLDRNLDWYNEQSAQYFGYISEKPIRTEVLDPTKKIVNANGGQVDSNSVEVGNNYTYNVHHTVPAEYPEFYYTSYSIEDTIHKALQIKDVKVYNRAGSNVTSKFNVSTTNNLVKVTAKNAELRKSAFYGEDYRLQIKVGVRNSKDLLTFANGSDSFIIDNKAIVKVSNDSKTTNTVRTTVTLPTTDLGFKKIQIFTNKASSGIPVLIDTEISNYYTMYADETFDVTLYQKNGSSRTQIGKQSIKLKDMPKLVTFNVPSDKLQKNTKRNYEAVISNYNGDYINVANNKKTIDTDGHTSAELTLTKSNADHRGDIKFEGVVKTEREVGKSMREYKETLTLDYNPKQSLKSGYGFDLYGKSAYTNEILSQVQSRFSIYTTTPAKMTVDSALLDDVFDGYQANNTVIPLSQSASGHTITYRAPKVFIAQNTGYSYTEGQKNSGAITGRSIDGGHRLYVPIWIDELGTYNITLKNDRPLGIHYINFNLVGQVEVTAYMFNHMDSETNATDELLVRPLDITE